MITAQTVLSALPSNKQEGDKFTQMLISEIKVYRDSLPVLVQLKVMEKVLKDVLTNDELDAVYLKEFKEFAKDNKLEVNGASLTSQEMGGRYDYTKDTEWNNLGEKINALIKIRGEREKVLKENGFPKIGGKIKLAVKL